MSARSLPTGLLVTMNADSSVAAMADIHGIIRRALSEVFQSSVERERQFYRRFRELSDKIEAMPDSITYHVLRGELLIERGEYERARADFQVAVVLADGVNANEGWGVIEQALRDRAIEGIAWVNRHS